MGALGFAAGGLLETLRERDARKHLSVAGAELCRGPLLVWRAVGWVDMDKELAAEQARREQAARENAARQQAQIDGLRARTPRGSRRRSTGCARYRAGRPHQPLE